MLLMKESVKQGGDNTAYKPKCVHCKMHVRAKILLLSVMDGGTEPFTGTLLQAGVDVELEAAAAPWLTGWGGGLNAGEQRAANQRQELDCRVSCRAQHIPSSST